jgi:hypothetical protein
LNRLLVTPPKASYLINLLDEIDKYVPNVQVQLFHLHGVDRIPHRVVLILHNEVLILHNAVLILYGADRIFKFGSPFLKFRR